MAPFQPIMILCIKKKKGEKKRPGLRSPHQSILAASWRWNYAHIYTLLGINAKHPLERSCLLG